MQEAEMFVKQTIYNHLRVLYRFTQKNEGVMDFDKQRTAILNPTKFKDAGEVGFMLDLMIYEREKKWDQYCEVCKGGVRDYYWDNAYQLNNLAWNVFENSENPKNLEMALAWAERATQLDGKKPYILDTYANLLYANSLYKEALKVENKALKLAEKEGGDTSSYKKVIEKIKAKMKS
ncbi:MAG: hypothetical protein U5L96_04150 [Owenweeksia sp.]|nr:hypothetical protein [Owenweeksia sp.]